MLIKLRHKHSINDTTYKNKIYYKLEKFSKPMQYEYQIFEELMLIIVDTLNPTNICSFKVNNRNTKKGVKYVQN